MLFYLALNFNGVGDYLTILGLSILAYEDIMYGEIHYRYLLLLVGFSYPIAYVFIIIVIKFYKNVSHLIGGADLLIFCLLISRYGLAVNMMLIYSCIFGIIYCLVSKNKQIKFIPFILISVIIYLGG